MDESAKICDLRQAALSFATERDWEQFHSPKNLAMALAGEAAELMEHFQWLTTTQSERDQLPDDSVEDIRQEMADIFLYLLRLSERLEIDLSEAVQEKLSINEMKYPIELAKGNATKYNRRTR